MRGNAPMNAPLDAARANLATMRQNKSNAYRSGMTDISKDKTALDFNDIDSALSKASSENKFGIKVDFYYQTRDIENISATKFMEAIDRYKYKFEQNTHTNEDFYSIMDFIPDEINPDSKYKIVKKLLIYLRY